MLAAGGLLGLLLMGAAVGGLVAGVGEGAEDDEDPRDAQPDDRPANDDTGSGAGGELLAKDGDHRPTREAGSLAATLFGAGMEDWGTYNATPIHENSDHPTTSPSEAAAQDAPNPLGQPAEVYDVVETAPFGPGPDLPVVSGFQPETDRLILDFEGTEDEAPQITVDEHSTSGTAVVEADGVPVVLVHGASAVTAEHVEVVMAPPSVDASHVGGEDDSLAGSAEMQGTLGGSAGSDSIAGEAVEDAGAAGLVTDFDPARDRIELLYDPAETPDPRVSVVDLPDGTGAAIMLDGETILRVAGAQGLDPALVELRATSEAQQG